MSRYTDRQPLTDQDWAPGPADENDLARRALDALGMGLSLGVGLLLIVVGWTATGDYRWAVYGVAVWLAGSIITAGLSSWRYPRPRRDKRNRTHGGEGS